MATTEAARLVVRGAELEVALGEVDAVLAAVPEGEYRARLERLREELVGGRAAARRARTSSTV